jgi:membrane-bound lytic murein transglycosylase D
MNYGINFAMNKSMMYITTLLYLCGNLVFASPFNKYETSDELLRSAMSEHGVFVNTIKKTNNISKKTSTTSLNYILNDPDDLISNEFSVPAKLRDRVRFWASVYAVYPSTTVIIHDKDDITIVYKVLDLTVDEHGKKIDSIYKTWQRKGDRNTETREIEKTLVSLSEKQSYKNLKGLEKKVYALWKNKIGKEKPAYFFKKASTRVRYQAGQKEYLVKGIQESGRYMPLMEQIFREEGLPLELTCLPFVESSFNLEASSKVGAKGIWQFMDDTGKNFLKMEKLIDERLSPLKATRAAAQLLKSNYNILKTWPLAVTAYNHGTGGLLRAIKKLKTRDLARIIDEHKGKTFGFASKNFYSEFLAALYVTKYHQKLFGPVSQEMPMEFVYVTVEHPVSIKEITNATGLNNNQIYNYNPDLKTELLKNEKVKLDKGVSIKLPQIAAYKVKDLFCRLQDGQELAMKKF